MDTRNTPIAQLTVPATGAHAENVDKPDTAESTGSCPGQANTALTTDGFKNENKTTAQQGEGDAVAATEDEAQPVEGDQQPKKVTEEGKLSEWYHDDDVPQGAQSESLNEVEGLLRKEGEAQGKGEEAGETKKTAQGDAEW